MSDPLVNSDPVGEALTATNAAGRFVFIPRAEFDGAADVGGWVGSVVQVNKDNQQLTKIKMHDKVQHYSFPYVANTFKPLS